MPRATAPVVLVARSPMDYAQRERLLAEFRQTAPYAGTPLIGVVAYLIAGDASTDALLIVADALDEAERDLEVFAGPRSIQRASLRALRDALRDEAPRRAARPAI